MAGIIALSAAGLVASRAAARLSPEDRYALDWLGLTEVHRSGWFILVLILLLLNLLALFAGRIPALRREARQKAPSALDLASAIASRKPDRPLYFDYQSAISREEFRDLVMAFAKGKIAKPKVLKDEGGLEELQIGANHGRLARLFNAVAHLGIVLMILGAAIGAYKGFDGRVKIDEGTRVGYLEIRRGNTQEWKPHFERDKEIAGFFESGFDIEVPRIDLRATVDETTGEERVRSMKATLKFHKDGVETTRRLGTSRPVSFEGIRFFLESVAETGRPGAALTVIDRAADAKGTPREEKINRVEGGMSFQRENARFRVVEVREDIETMGPGMQIELDGETFWVFKRYPDYDAIHRKRSRYVFKMDDVTRGRSVELIVVKDPGAYLVAAGAAIFALALLLALRRSHDRFWFVWNPSRVTLLASSHRPFLFPPKFVAMNERFRKKLLKADKSAKLVGQGGGAS